MESHKKEKIPIYFNNLSDDENILIGNGTFNNNRNNYKFSNQKTQSTNQKRPIKEFTLVNKTNPDSLYKGREFTQDSCYILMEYKQNSKKFVIYPANKWVNFKKSFNYKIDIQTPPKKDPSTSIDKKKFEQNEQLEAIESNIKKKKKEKAELNKLFKFSEYSKIKSDTGKKKSGKQKISNRNIKNNEENNDENLDEEKGNYDFDEDSHSSEKSPNLDDSDEPEKEEISENKNKKEENTENKQKEESLEDEDFEFEDSYSSEVDEKKMEKDDELFGHLNNNKNNSFDVKNSDLLNKKRERNEKGNYDLIKESIINLFAKKNRMTYEEIFEGLMKEYKSEVIQEHIDDLLNNCTRKYVDDKGETYYFWK